MAAKTKYSVTVDGREFTRSSFNIYTHVLVSNGWKVVAWSGSEDGAYKRMRELQRSWPDYQYEVRAIEDVKHTVDEDGMISIEI